MYILYLVCACSDISDLYQIQQELTQMVQDQGMDLNVIGQCIYHTQNSTMAAVVYEIDLCSCRG